MSNIKPTPGPWYYHEQGDSCFYAITHYKEKRKSVDWLMCIHHNGEQLLEEERANMQLIAAAPELLEALRAAWSFIENTPEDAPDRNEKFFNLRALVRETFAKAKGDSHEEHHAGCSVHD